MENDKNFILSQLQNCSKILLDPRIIRYMMKQEMSATNSKLFAPYFELIESIDKLLKHTELNRPG